MARKKHLNRIKKIKERAEASQKELDFLGLGYLYTINSQNGLGQAYMEIAALEEELELQKKINMLTISFINDKGLANEFISYIPTQTK